MRPLEYNLNPPELDALPDYELYLSETEYYENLIIDMESRCLANNREYCNECRTCHRTKK